MTEHFADRLMAAVKSKKTPLLVGLDPVLESLPEALRQPAISAGITDMQAGVDALFDFSLKVLHVVAPLVPAVKINSAFFEAYHSEGIEIYESLIQEAHALGLVVIADVKRGDIGNTAQYYAQGCLANPAYDSMLDHVGPDAVTVNPYMGLDALSPFLKVAREQGKGLFALVRTSNPSAAVLQDAKLEDGRTVYQLVGELVNQWGTADCGKSGYSSLGAVVGATNPQQLTDLRQRMPNTIFLVPGFGAQGGSAADAAKAFKSDGTGAIINSSRGIIFAYKDPKWAGPSSGDWQKAIELATLDTIATLRTAIGG
jgi:orotidine-5'-phosphate decarboxylase